MWSLRHLQHSGTHSYSHLHEIFLYCLNVCVRTFLNDSSMHSAPTLTTEHSLTLPSTVEYWSDHIMLVATQSLRHELWVNYERNSNYQTFLWKVCFKEFWQGLDRLLSWWRACLVPTRPWAQSPVYTQIKS